MAGIVAILKSHTPDIIHQQTGSSLLVKGGGYAGI
jgi:hypothetical protein